MSTEQAPESMTDNTAYAEGLMGQARQAIDAAADKGIVLRLCGGLAIWSRCDQSRALQMRKGRFFSDIDLAGYLKDKQSTEACFREIGCAIDPGFATVPGLRRSQFSSSSGEVRFDVYYDVLKFCHTIDLRKRVESEPNQITVPLAELLLQKLQIVELTEKDVVDAQSLLFAHSIAASDEEGINGPHLGRLCGRDWGLWRTVTDNLYRIEALTEADSELSTSERQVIVSRIGDVQTQISKSPRSFGWRMRSIVGTRVRWYTPVEAAAPTMNDRLAGNGE